MIERDKNMTVKQPKVYQKDSRAHDLKAETNGPGIPLPSVALSVLGYKYASCGSLACSRYVSLRKLCYCQTVKNSIPLGTH